MVSCVRLAHLVSFAEGQDHSSGSLSRAYLLVKRQRGLRELDPKSGKGTSIGIRLRPARSFEWQRGGVSRKLRVDRGGDGLVAQLRVVLRHDT